MRSDLSEPPEAEASATLESLLVPMWRSRVWIVVTVILGLGAGAFYGAIQPNIYQSFGKLLTTSGAREQASAESRVVGDRPDSISNREMVANEMHLLSSPVVYENVVQRVGADRILDSYDPSQGGPPSGGARGWMHRFQSWWFARSSPSELDLAGQRHDGRARTILAAYVLQRSLGLRNEPGSSVITVSCTSNSAELSADLVNAYIEESLLQHQRVFSSESALGFLDTQVADALAATAESNEALANYRISCGFYDAEGQRQQILSDANTIERDLALGRAQMAALEAKEALVLSELDKEPLVHRLTMEGPIDRNPERTRIQQRILQMRDDLLVLESRRDLTAQQRESQAKVVNQQLEVAQEELLRQPEFLKSGERAEEVLNPRYQRLREQLDLVREDQVFTAKSTQKLEERLNELHEQLEFLERCRPQLQTLESAATLNEQRLEQFLTARERVAVMNMLDTVNLINLRPLQAGTVPLTKSGPRRGRLVAIGALLGLLVGVGMALLRQRLDRRLRTLDDVERQLGLAVLGVVPHIGGTGQRGAPPARKRA